MKQELNLRELVRTTDPVLISAIEALLNSARIRHVVADQNMSILEGSIGIFPRRILVREDEINMARRLLEDAGFGHELRPQDSSNDSSNERSGRRSNDR
jgi:Putative prokaryotic signal transducing protein